MLVATVLSMLTVIIYVILSVPDTRCGNTFIMGFTIAYFNILVQWHGLHPDENGFVQLSIAEFSL